MSLHPHAIYFIDKGKFSSHEKGGHGILNVEKWFFKNNPFYRSTKE
jgi:hypothetical protein